MCTGGVWWLYMGFIFFYAHVILSIVRLVHLPALYGGLRCCSHISRVRLCKTYCTHILSIHTNRVFQVWIVYIYTRIHIFLNMLNWKIFQKYRSLLDNVLLASQIVLLSHFFSVGQTGSQICLNDSLWSLSESKYFLNLDPVIWNNWKGHGNSLVINCGNLDFSSIHKNNNSNALNYSPQLSAIFFLKVCFEDRIHPV